MGINPRRAPPGAPAARPTNAPQIKPGVQAETFRRAAADMRKAGAPPNVIEPVLAAEQEARQRLSEAKASSKVEAARHAASQAQTAVESAGAIVAAAEEALSKARERLERCKQRHHERVAAVQVEEGFLVAAKPAEIVAADMATKATRLLEWFRDKFPEEQFQNHSLELKVAVQDLEAATFHVQKVLNLELRAASDDPGDMDADDEHDPSLSQAIRSAISGVDIAVLDTNGDTFVPAIDETEHAVVKETFKDLWIDLQTRGGNPEAGQALVLGTNPY